MQVLAGVEGLDERLVAGQVRHETHFDLRVVGAHEGLVALARDEGAADAHAVGAARGDVLQVGVGGGQASRGRSDLGEGRVDAGVGCDGGGQGVDHLLELDAVAVGEKETEEVVPRSPALLGLGPQVRQRVGVRRVAGLGLLGLGQPEVVEEDFLELLGAGEVHLASGGGPRAVAGGIDVGAELGREVVEDAGVRGDADGLHLG